MGFSYCNGNLCCDMCGDYIGVRKFSCPFGYCPSIAMCRKCRHEHPEYVSKAYHREHGNCEHHHLESQRRQAQKLKLLNEGKMLRCSALQHKFKAGRRIKVIFQGLGDKVSAYWMAPRTYRAIELLVPATVEDYRAIGKVTRARNTQIYDTEGRL